MQTEKNSSPSPIHRWLAIVEKVEQFALTFFLASMILLASLQIAMRWLTSGGIIWVDPLLRHLVLWGGLAGAVFATSKGNHIAINVIDYLLTDTINQRVKMITNLFSAVISGFLCYSSILFIRSEMTYGSSGLFNFPSWVWVSIFPVAFVLICLHFIVALVIDFNDCFLTSKTPPGGTGQ